MGGYSRERKHLIFTKGIRLADRKTDTWSVTNGEGHYLAKVVYRPGWRRYVLRFAGSSEIDFDANCMRQAVEFLEDETAKLRATWKKP